jgi:predicted ester cyclase
MHADIEDEIREGDKVAVRVTMHGRHLGEFLGHAPTGREFATESRFTSTGCRTER